MRQLKTALFAVLWSVAIIAGASPRLAARQQAPAPPAAVTPSKPAALTRAALEQKIDELINAHASANNFSGAILVASEGKPLVAKGYGYANREWQIPNTTTTRFRIGSMTKAFTSMIIMQLRERGRIKLEESVCAYLAPCPETWKPVTIHHLLTHTSGIPTYTGLPGFRGTMMVPKTVDQVISMFRDLPLQWVPGEKYAYNNSGYFLLGAVIEKITQKKYDQVLQELILTPLDLAETGYDWSRTVLSNRASGYAVRNGAVENADAIDMQQPFAAGSMYSTVGDLLKWDQALYTEKLLPVSSTKIMLTPFLNDYAYGWTIAPPAPTVFGGHPRIAHTGGINGFSSVIVRVPDIRLTVIVLTNVESGNAGLVARDIGAIYFGQPYTLPARK